MLDLPKKEAAIASLIFGLEVAKITTALVPIGEEEEGYEVYFSLEDLGHEFGIPYGELIRIVTEAPLFKPGCAHIYGNAVYTQMRDNGQLKPVIEKTEPSYRGVFLQDWAVFPLLIHLRREGILDKRLGAAFLACVDLLIMALGLGPKPSSLEEEKATTRKLCFLSEALIQLEAFAGEGQSPVLSGEVLITEAVHKGMHRLLLMLDGKQDHEPPLFEEIKQLDA